MVRGSLQAENRRLVFAARDHLRDPQDRLRSGAAILLAVVFHVLLFYGFRSERPAAEPPAEAEQPQCVFLGAAARNTEWERELRAWCDLADPTLLSLPSETLGFSRIRRIPRVLPHQSAPAYTYERPFAEEQALARLVLPDEVPDYPERLRNAWSMWRAPLPDPDPMPALPRGVLWRTVDGQPLSAMPAVDMEAVVAALAQGPEPVAPTQVEISRDTRRLRVRVRQSCGNAELDLLAVSALYRRLGSEQRLVQGSVSGGERALLPPDTDRRRFVVEWRLIPEDGEPAP